MKRAILLKYGEIILKGDNRYHFEDVLRQQIKKRLAPLGEFSVTCAQSTLFVTAEDDALLDAAYPLLKRVFGVISLTLAYAAEKDMDAILACAEEHICPLLAGKKSFKADAKRSDKRFPLKSPEIARAVGGRVLSVLRENAPKVDVHDPEITIRVEIRDDYAYLHAGQERGAGGLPYGTSGRALLLLSGGIDSPVAGYRMARRGAKIDALHFESFPYTSERAKEKVVTLAQKLCRYTDEMNLGFCRLTDLQLALKAACREEYFTILLRRSMIRIANRVARHQGCKSLVTGESLGQVASQTMDALACTDRVADLPVFRPLIGLDKEEIIRTAREIDCFETSILPYEDCCTVFTPRHPKLTPAEDEILAEEAKLDLPALEDAAYKAVTWMKAR
ncbi:MAG: tRNA 4-thiouridine(8) synthase ThiI [Clostridia bacterium]|nr:tRNA 4-thiouridine(8) synthase ThiI [Clostridia bacterium]